MRVYHALSRGRRGMERETLVCGVFSLYSQKVVSKVRVSIVSHFFLVDVEHLHWAQTLRDAYMAIEDDLHWECRANGKPQPVYRWLKNGEVLASQVRTPRSLSGFCVLLLGQWTDAERLHFISCLLYSVSKHLPLQCKSQRPPFIYLISSQNSHSVLFISQEIFLR